MSTVSLPQASYGREGEDGSVIGIVDDDSDFACWLGAHAAGLGFQCVEFSSGEEILAALSMHMFSAILLDLGMPGLSGRETLKLLRERLPDVPIIIISADGEVVSVVECMKMGAYDYLSKPVSTERLETVLRHAVERYQLTMQIKQLQRDTTEGAFESIIGLSAPMQTLFRTIKRVAATDISVLIRGESGTGKELVARAIHRLSSRTGAHFVALNAAAIPESLLEAELFGHEKGAFTGAVSRRTGRIEEANRGTLFLDEIGELPLSMQAKLLRVIQERQFQRIGGSTMLNSDFRLVVATHRNLAALVRDGLFREDLFFRIAVFDLEVPPLRERASDVPLLATRFIEMYRKSTGTNAKRLSGEAAAYLSSLDWPGNVRELQNVMQRAMVLCEGEEIQTAHLPGGKPGGWARERVVAERSVRVGRGGELKGIEELERSAITEAIIKAKGNISEAMRLLKIGRNRFYRKIHKYRLMELVESAREQSESTRDVLDRG